MNPRNTRTGAVLEQMIYPALAQGGYSYHLQRVVGRRFNERKHKIDIFAEKNGQKILISLKWQQSSGTAEQKLPYEVMCLVKAKREGHYDKAYVVMGGNGWTLKEFYQTQEFKSWITDSQEVIVSALENFIALANNGRL